MDRVVMDARPGPLAVAQLDHLRPGHQHRGLINRHYGIGAQVTAQLSFGL